MQRQYLPDWLGADVAPEDQFGVREVSRAVRNRNPGNIKARDPWIGRVRVQWETPESFQGEHCAFEAVCYGWRAMARTIHTYMHTHGLLSLSSITGRWAPAGVDNNEPNGYAEYVAQRLGWHVNSVIPWEPWAIAMFCYAMAELETGLNKHGKNYWGWEACEAGIAMAFGLVDPHPLSGQRLAAPAPNASSAAPRPTPTLAPRAETPDEKLSEALDHVLGKAKGSGLASVTSGAGGMGLLLWAQEKFAAVPSLAWCIVFAFLGLMLGGGLVWLALAWRSNAGRARLELRRTMIQDAVRYADQTAYALPSPGTS